MPSVSSDIDGFSEFAENALIQGVCQDCSFNYQQGCNLGLKVSVLRRTFEQSRLG